jgi:hypothetical protein
MHVDPTDDQAAIRDSIRKSAGAEPASGYPARAKPGELFGAEFVPCDGKRTRS